MSDVDPILASALADDEEPRPGDPAPRSGRADCANCGAPLAGAYCAACGQRDQPLRQPVHRFLAQSVTEFFGIDGRVWVTLRALLFRPGALTVAYVEGQRRRFLRPLRVYLTSTLLFFVLLAVLDPADRLRETFSQGAVTADSTVVVGERLAEVEARLAGAPAAVAERRAEVDSLQAVVDRLRAAAADSAGARADSAGAVATGDDEALAEALDALDDARDDLDDAQEDAAADRRRLRLEAALLGVLPPDSTVRLADVHEARARIYPETNANINLPDGMARSGAIRRINAARSQGEVAEAGAAFAREAIGQVPTALFLILPVFALLLKVLYARRDWFYAEHLVFGLHTHAFAFVVFTAIACLLAVTTADWAVTLSLVLFWLGIPLYFLLAQKRVYGQGWAKTVVKALVLGWAYSIVLFWGLIGVLVLAAALGS